MTTLAEAFLLDFEGSDDEEDINNNNNNNINDKISNNNINNDIIKVDNNKMDIDDDDDNDDNKKNDNNMNDVDKMLSITSVQSNLLEDDQLKEFINDIKEVRSLKTLNREREHQLIVKANEYHQQINDEISQLHRNLSKLYAHRLKELEQIVPNPIEYANVVLRLLNEDDLTKIDLTDMLPNHTILTITVTATTTERRLLTPKELQDVIRLCQNIIKLNDIRLNILSYCESRMLLIAPNVSAILGTEITAILLGIVGSIRELADIVACNLQVVGAERADTAGFAATAGQPHFGLIAKCDLIMSLPNELKKKALRVLSNKCALAARIDAHGNDSTGETGKKFRQQMEKKFEKWQEPLEKKIAKALPKPIMVAKKRRAGRKMRKRKSLSQTSELHKLKNRVEFGKAEVTDDYTGETFGLIGAQGSGTIRAIKKTKQQTVNNKANMKRLQNTTKRSGLASTIALTPAQGMELVNPNAAKELEAAKTNKYFSNTGKFFQVGQKTEK